MKKGNLVTVADSDTKERVSFFLDKITHFFIDPQGRLRIVMVNNSAVTVNANQYDKLVECIDNYCSNG